MKLCRSCQEGKHSQCGAETWCACGCSLPTAEPPGPEGIAPIKGSVTYILRCAVCPTTQALGVFPLAGWRASFEGDVFVEGYLCPEHAVIAAFFAKQCPGCIETWPHCVLQKVLNGAIQAVPEDVPLLLEGYCAYRQSAAMLVLDFPFDEVHAPAIALGRHDRHGGVALAQLVREIARA